MYYVYRHIRLDKNEPFYIGMGTKDKSYSTFRSEYSRAFDTSQRSRFWMNVAKNGFEVEILFESQSKEEIKDKEKEFIVLYKFKGSGGTLVNLTGGGETHGASTELRVNMSNRMKGNKLMVGRKLSYQWRQSISKSLNGRKMSEVGRSALSKRSIGNKYSLGAKRTLEFKSKLSAIKMGNTISGVKVMCENDGIIHNSYSSAAKFYFSNNPIHRISISKSCVSGEPYNGLNFRKS